MVWVLLLHRADDEPRVELFSTLRAAATAGMVAALACNDAPGINKAARKAYIDFIRATAAHNTTGPEFFAEHLQKFAALELGHDAMVPSWRQAELLGDLEADNALIELDALLTDNT